MKKSYLVHSLLALTLLALLASGCSALGSKKPGVKIVATPSSGDVELVNAFVTHDPSLLENGELVPSFIPNNIKKIYLGIRFKNLGTDVNRFKVDYKIIYKGIGVETEFDSQPTSWNEKSSNATVLILPIRRVDKTPFADGEYDAQILMDGQVVAVIHYKVGGGED